MSLRLGINIAGLQAQRQLDSVSSLTSKVSERLATGRRINKASDDAAGLAIAADLNARTRVFTQAIRNGNDGLSALSIADSALGSLTDITVRLTELASQAANGTYSKEQREALDNEAQALRAEYLRVVQSSAFNGQNLLDGSSGSGIRLQLGFGELGSLLASMGGAIGTGSFGAATTYLSGSGTYYSGVASADINGDGIVDLVTGGDEGLTFRYGNGDGTFGAVLTADNSFPVEDLTLGDINGDGWMDIVASTGTELIVSLANGNGGFSAAYTVGNLSGGGFGNKVELADFNNDGRLDIVASGGTGNGQTYVYMATGSGTFNLAFSTASRDGYGLAVGDMNNDGNLDFVQVQTTAGGGTPEKVMMYFGSGAGGFSLGYSIDIPVGTYYDVDLADLDGDGALDVVMGGRIAFNNGNGSFSTPTALSGGDQVEAGDLNGDGLLDLIYDNGSFRLNLGNRTFGSLVTDHPGFTPAQFGAPITLNDFNGDGVLDRVIAGDNGAGNGIFEVEFGSTTSGASPLLSFSLATMASSRQALGLFSRTLDNLTLQRGTIGASQSRITSAVDTIFSSRDNFRAGESRIVDADVAADSAELARSEVLKQSAANVLKNIALNAKISLSLLRASSV